MPEENNLDELKVKRAENKLKELSQIELSKKYDSLMMNRYYLGAVESSMEDLQFQYNNSMLMDVLKEWIEKVDKKQKPDQYKKLTIMMTACVEMFVHQSGFKSKLAYSIVETEKWKDQWKIQQNKNIILEDEITSLKAQIQFNEETKV